MNRRCLILAGALVATFAGGCSTQPPAPAVDPDDKVYVTGSRIPRNDRTAPGVKATDDQNTIKAIMRSPSPGASGN